MTTSAELIELAARVESGNGVSNSLDITIEIALFNPPDDGWARSVRKNAAGTKLIYTKADGSEQTCWAGDWTMDRKLAASLLRARAALAEQEGL